MKRRLIAASIFLATAGAIAFHPSPPGSGGTAAPRADPPVIAPAQGERPLVELVFVLDTTSSMSGLIEAAKEKIWSIATTLASAQPTPELRLGLVAYRDRGDAWVTQVTDLSADLDSTYATLMDYRAVGGGDGPESVNEALHDALHRISWSRASGSYRVIFLVGDAPPHMDYQDDVKYPETLAAAAQQGIIVNAIQAGEMAATRQAWQQIARLGSGEFFQVGADGGAVAIATPFDRKMAELSRELDGTRFYYGSAAEREAKRHKLDAAQKLHADASLESRARRATFNASAAGKSNLIGDKELVEDVASGRVDLASVPPASLPAPLQALAPAEQEALIAETAARRGALQRQLGALAAKRTDYLREQVVKSGGAADSLDDQLYRAVREQAGGRGLHYAAELPAY
jgi:hypothetical protein